jgi:hypothetical protein
MIDNRICAIALAAFGTISIPPAIAAPFDGNWSVVALWKHAVRSLNQSGPTLFWQWILRLRLPGAVGWPRLPLRVCAGKRSGWPAHRACRRTPPAVSGRRDLGR